MGLDDHFIHPLASGLHILPADCFEGALGHCPVGRVQQNRSRLGISHDNLVSVVAVTDYGGLQVYLNGQDLVVATRSVWIAGAHQNQEIGIKHGLIDRSCAQLAHLA